MKPGQSLLQAECIISKSITLQACILIKKERRVGECASSHLYGGLSLTVRATRLPLWDDGGAITNGPASPHDGVGDLQIERSRFMGWGCIVPCPQ